MNEGRNVFTQLLDFLPKYEFELANRGKPVWTSNGQVGGGKLTFDHK